MELSVAAAVAPLGGASALRAPETASPAAAAPVVGSATPPVSLPSSHSRSGHDRASESESGRARHSIAHEDSTFMTDEDFYDAQEDLDAEASRHTGGSGASGAEVTTDDCAHIEGLTLDHETPAAIETAIDAAAATATVDTEVPLASADASDRDAGSSDDMSEHKYIVKNQDTGEVYDIRDLAKLPSDTYSIFPNDFLPPQEPTTSKRTKTRRPSLTKLRLKFPIKSKAREATKRNHVQVFSSKREKREFDELALAQTLARHNGTIWTMKFSHDGARLVSGGQDAILRVWKVVLSSDESGASTGSHESGEKQILEAEPEQAYQGHTMPIVDVSWSRSNFILSASMDKTVRLWHISREDCLHVFQHPDSVPAVDFHPKEDRYFLSGCFDNKARVWDIPDGCVVSYVQTPVMITAASFNPSGTRAIVGLLNGQCIFYQVNAHQQLNYYTQIECRNSRGPMKKGRKVTGIEFDPEGKNFMVSTNDSRMRLFSVDNYSRVCKYKGLVNDHLQIKGRFSQDGDFVICGSENGSVYVWNKASKQDRNASYEYFCAAEPPNGIVTVALFAPASTFAMVKSKLEAGDDIHTNACIGLIVTASYDGCIKFFERLAKT